MTSLTQIEANPRNALCSTGPASEVGTAFSAECGAPWTTMQTRSRRDTFCALPVSITLLLTGSTGMRPPLLAPSRSDTAHPRFPATARHRFPAMTPYFLDGCAPLYDPFTCPKYVWFGVLGNTLMASDQRRSRKARRSRKGRRSGVDTRTKEDKGYTRKRRLAFNRRSGSDRRSVAVLDTILSTNTYDV